MSESLLVWALFDKRAGNRNQLYGILNHLRLPYKSVNIIYNKFAILPNFFIQITYNLIHVKEIDLSLKTTKPDILISCGRRTAPVALEITKKLKKKPFLIQMMYPSSTLYKSTFDIIVTPKHDNIRNQSNIFSVLGTPNQIKLLIKNDKSRLDTKCLVKPIITVLIGGDHGIYKLSPSSIRDIFENIYKKLKNNGTIFISTSRRTNRDTIIYIDGLKKHFTNIKQIYHPNLKKERNPMFQFLKLSEEIIVTGESMSMVSEVCELKKPVRIYFNKSICSSKQINFCKKLIEDGYAFPFETFRKKCKNIKVLNSAKHVASVIKNRILSKYGKNKC